MDRDQREERTQEALDLLRAALAEHHADSGVQAVRAAYERGEATSSSSHEVGAEARIRPQDRVIAFNFRPDRMRQLTGLGGADEVLAAHRPVARYTTLTEYEEGWPWPVAFPPAARDHDDQGHRAGAATGSCTSPRPRSTRT